jgi:hypothetical protein
LKGYPRDIPGHDRSCHGIGHPGITLPDLQSDRKACAADLAVEVPQGLFFCAGWQQDPRFKRQGAQSPRRLFIDGPHESQGALDSDQSRCFYRLFEALPLMEDDIQHGPLPDIFIDDPVSEFHGRIGFPPPVDLCSSVQAVTKYEIISL